MRFKTGSKVEILSKGEVPAATWHCAEIISGNGHYYNVKYDCNSGITSENFVERIPRKAIRPYPPPVKVVKNWKVGDVVEVLDDCSWNVATILNVLSGHYYLVRLFDTSKECKVHRSALRMCQSWKDNEWIMITKGSESCENTKFRTFLISNHCQRKNLPAPPSDVKIKLHAGDGCLGIQKNGGHQNSLVESSRALKRASQFATSHVEAAVSPQKLRAIEKQGELHGVVSGYPSRLLNKVDAVAYERENLDETYKHASSNQKPVFHEMERGRKNVRVECFPRESSEPNDSSSDSCSVGSCSVVSSSPNNLLCHNLAVPSQEADSLSSEAQSFIAGGDEEGKWASTSLPPKEDVAEKIHILEVHAYRCTLEALYASGPLSWEQEAMLTNLRLSLHISNDEHMTELKNLISGGIGSLMS